MRREATKTALSDWATDITKETKLTKELDEPTTNMVRETLDPKNAWEWIEERASILEFDAGMNRAEANHRAFMLWFGRFVEKVSR
jgi:hypothetical protein